MNLTVDQDRLLHELETLASFSDAPAPAVTRVVFSPADLKARAYLKSLCEDAGLVVREDPVGNTFARWPGAEPDLPAVGTGSHTDAIPFSGRYDGTAGVLGGLEAIRALQRAQRKASPAAAREAAWASLSAREQQVARAVCEGLTDKEIARRAGVGVPTVRTYLRRIFGKLGIERRSALAAWVPAH